MMLIDLLIRLRALFHRKSVESELDDEIRFHFEQQVAKYIASGMSRGEATRSARLEFGGLDQVKEECRDARGINFLDSTARDVRYGLRMLRKSPGFTLVAVLTLALGIGANTAIFSILESQLWRPLPFPDSERLMEVHTALKNNPKQWDVLSAGVFRAWQSEAHSFNNLAAYSYPNFRNLSANGTSERGLVMPVGSNFFDTLEIPLAHGRAFLPGEDAPGRDHVAILTDAIWRDQFGSDAQTLGRIITIDGESYTVVGIAPPTLRFEYMDEPSIFVPLAALDASEPVIRNLYALGRIAPGSTPDRARVELTAIMDHEVESEGRASEDVAAVSNLREDWTQFAARPLYFFAGAVMLILLIACVNTAALLFARGLARRREFALRAALGAARSRVICQLLVETVLLALIGGVVGALVGVWLSGSVSAFMPEDALARHTAVALDGRVFVFAVAISIASALAAGLLPAAFASRTDLNDALRQSAPGPSAGRSQRFVRSLLVATEVALGLVLLFGAGLFLSSFVRLQQAPRGFEAPGALSFRISLRGGNYSQPDQMQRYFDRLTSQLASTPGVREVTFGSGLPLTGSESLFATVNVAGRPPLPHGSFVTLHYVAPNYFQLLRMRLLAGRIFNPQDTATSPRVAIVNRNVANDLFGHEDPVGKVLNFVPDERRAVPAQAPVQIVGVIENAQEFDANEVPFDTVYVLFSQHPVPSSFVLVSATVPRGALAGVIRQIAYTLDKDQSAYDMKTMDDRITDSLSGARATLYLVAALAAVAMLLVSVGTFGMVAYFVQQRTQEFGIRLALGAAPARILRHAISQSLRVGIAGLSVGVLLALALGRLLGQTLYLVPHVHTGMLYAVKIYDPVSMACACTLLIAVIFLASYLPARRAAKVDPLAALRYE